MRNACFFLAHPVQGRNNSVERPSYFDQLKSHFYTNSLMFQGLLKMKTLEIAWVNFPGIVLKCCDSSIFIFYHAALLLPGPPYS